MTCSSPKQIREDRRKSRRAPLTPTARCPARKCSRRYAPLGKKAAPVPGIRGRAGWLDRQVRRSCAEGPLVLRVARYRSITMASRWTGGIVVGRRPFFGTVIGKFHTHPGSNFPVGSNPQDLFNSVPSFVVARGGVTRINLNNTQNFLGPRSVVLR